MKLWKISQDFNNKNCTYDSAIVAAETEDDARNTDLDAENDFAFFCPSWAPPEHVKVEYLGEAKTGTEAGIILESFNVEPL
jgi:hypothetical protein